MNLIEKQKGGLDSYLFPLGYIKKIYGHDADQYVSRVKGANLRGKIVEYVNQEIGKKICLFFDMILKKEQLSKIFLFQYLEKEDRVIEFIDFSTLQKDTNLFFDNTRDLRNITPMQIIKVLDAANGYHTSKNYYPKSSNQLDSRRSVSYLFLKENLIFLEDEYGFYESYFSRDFPNYFNLFQSIVVYKKGEIEVVSSYYLMKDEWQFIIFISVNGLETKKLFASIFGGSKEEVILECKRHLKGLIG